MALVKGPVAMTGPSVVLLSAVVGLADVLQTTPCWVGFGTPSAVTLPFPVAVVLPMDETAWVVTVGGTRVVRAVKLTSPPYDVPAVLVAYART